MRVIIAEWDNKKALWDGIVKVEHPLDIKFSVLKPGELRVSFVIDKKGDQVLVLLLKPERGHPKEPIRKLRLE